MRQVGNSLKAIPTNAGNALRQVGANLRAIPTKAGDALRNVGAAIKAMPDNIGAAIKGLPGQLRAMRAAASAQLVAGLKGIALGIRAMGLAALGNPLLWVAIAIAGAAILIFKYWKPITAFFKGVWAGIKEGLAPLKSSFSKAFAPLAPILRPIMGAVKSLWGWIKNLLKPVDDVGGKSQNMGKQFGLAIAGMIKKLGELLKVALDMPGKLLQVGKDMAAGLLKGFEGVPLLGRFAAKAREAVQGTKAGAETRSPSRATMWVGDMMGRGLYLGMEAQTRNIVKASNRMAQAAIPKMPALSLAGGPRAAGSGAGSGGAARNITFAPVLQITVAPGSNIGTQVQQAVTDSYPQSVALMRRYEHDQRRGNPA